MHEKIKALADAELDAMIKVRRHLHMYPEVSFHEEQSARYISSVLQEYGIVHRTGVGGGFGIVATIDSGKPGPNVAFRADFDALPLDEASAVDFRSRNPGVMHACGHDAHAAMLLGFGHVLSRNTDLFSGRVTLLFQPAEELPPGGAAPMMEAGCMDGVNRIFAMHVEPSLEVGTIGVCPGPYMAASDMFSFTISGDGGHGSRPQDAKDVLSAACDSVGMINTIVSRRVPSDESVVISVCNIHAGTSYNILPSTITFAGTVRTFERSRADMVRGALEQAVAGVCASYGVDYTYTFEYGYPVLVNDAQCTAMVREAVASLQDIRVVEIPPSTVAEDFTYYLNKAPGCFFRVGVRNEAAGCVHLLHNDRFTLDETAMSVGLQAFLALGTVSG